jgi:hypothetical protein
MATAIPFAKIAGSRRVESLTSSAACARDSKPAYAKKRGGSEATKPDGPCVKNGL